MQIVFILGTFFTYSQSKESLAEGIIYNHDLFNASENSDISCYRIPAIVTAPNGDVIVAIDERVPSCGDLKWSKDINIVVRRSSDNGETWSEIERAVDFCIRTIGIRPIYDS